MDLKFSNNAAKLLLFMHMRKYLKVLYGIKVRILNNYSSYFQSFMIFGW